MCNVLIVEDNGDVRETLAQWVEDAGHTHHEASNGAEALQWLGEQDEPPCMVVLDLRMPVMDGWDFLQVLQADPRWTDLPVIVISATIEEGRPKPVLPARAFWSKPPDAEKVERIYEYCARHRDSWKRGGPGS